jgi:4-alpha-glucanotransferase
MFDLSWRRRSGILVPLFSCPSSTSWGIGEIRDLPALTRWLAGAGQSVLQVLPLNEMAPGQQSPYSAISAMATDPVYIHVADVPEFAAAGGERSLDQGERELLDLVRRSPSIDYARVRALKESVLRRAFDRFVDVDWSFDTARARTLKAFVEREAWWLDEYALFRALHEHEGERPWSAWPEPLRQREPDEMTRARRDLARDIQFYQYLQWIAARQWQVAREQTSGVVVFGDLPFMVNGDSADVWARQDEFRFDVGIGAPPDEFSATGQKWGNPLYRWDIIKAGGFQWLRERSRRAAALFDGYRIDHLVGFFRTFAWPNDGSPPFFTPSEQEAQIALGEQLLGVFRESGAALIAEDLGTVPDFVRASLKRLGVPGFCVFRWERHWHTEGFPFREPTEYPAISVATSGTHDTEPMVTWWESLTADVRNKVRALATIQRIDAGAREEGWNDAPFNPTVRDALLEVLFASGSNLLLLPIQDVFGWRDRVNDPATASDSNWSYRLPWSCDRLDDIPEARERQAALRRWSAGYRRVAV